MFSLAADLRAQVGESPVWDAARGLLWMVDILAPCVIRFDPATGVTRRIPVPEVCGSLALCRSGALLVAQRASLVRLDPATGAITPFATLAEEPGENRLNDGKVGPDGCFWVGSMDDRPEKHPTGLLWRIKPDGRAERRREGLVVSNGLAWSPDGRTIWHADSRLAVLDCADFDPATGSTGPWRRLRDFDEATGRPDGAACDAQGNYWSAGVSAGRINVIAPDGTLLRHFDFPVPAPTMPCFAGPDLSTLFVTSLRAGKDPAALAAHPSLGGLFRAEGLGQGAPVPLFAD
ncbi:SMP-30/gluconolactonase/LRE family protein [Falsiroseomonas sp.]|uniref:SMP-30/gluconolactonase/LRE family protein n=1 Tax=Falsiroseomonas sp. TaxID=2870721 RepID=UPI003F6F5C4B